MKKLTHPFVVVTSSKQNQTYLACFAHEARKDQNLFKCNSLVNLATQYALKSLQSKFHQHTILQNPRPPPILTTKKN